VKKNLESIIAAIIGIVVIISAGFLYQQNNNRPWTLDRFKSQKLHWQNCADGSQCSTFKVPIDYSNLDGGNFTLQVLRHLATSKNKLGSLFVNPGGPGGSALDYAAGAT
jgi:hypothetical protein